MVAIPKAVLRGAALVIGGLIAFAVTNPHFGAGLVAVGVIWIFIGNGILHLGFMTGDTERVCRGSSAVSAGLVLLFFVLRKDA